MYLRTTRRRNSGGKEVAYLQLAENVWDAKRGCAVARIVYNFGRADRVDPDALRRLAHSILRAVDDAKGVAEEAGVTVRGMDAGLDAGPIVAAEAWRRARGPVPAELFELVRAEKADLIVAGGYGHSRLGEWIFGGITDEMLASSPVCCMLSH